MADESGAEPPAFLHGFARPTSTRFVSIVRGDGAAVFDDTGRRYVDALASLWYCQIGHGRPEIGEAITAQLGRLAAFSTFEMFTNPVADELCRRLVELAPMPDARVMLMSSGSEAVDTAVKLARATFVRRGQPERTEIVARDLAYHGTALGGTTLQGLVPNRTGFGPLVEGVHHVPHDDLDALADAVERIGPERIAAVVAEPVLGAGGVRPAPPGYLAGLRAMCDAIGALLVLDEVICGFGRLGTWWGAERHAVVPDVVTFAKGVTSGYQPVGGVLVGRTVRDALEADDTFVLRHGSTYAGHPVGAAAALANLDLLVADDLVGPGAARISSTLGPGLRSLVDHGLLAEARGEGGMWAAGLLPGIAATDVRDRMLDHGVIARPIFDHTVAFCPPLVITDDDLRLCLDALRAALVDLTS